MSSDSAQKYIGRNRAPRVQIEYDLETYGAKRRVELPFVVGVMADLAGDTQVTDGKGKPMGLAQREFRDLTEFKAKGDPRRPLDPLLAEIKPSLNLTIKDRITGGDDQQIKIQFRSMDDFTPAGIARRMDTLKPLLDVREQLANLLTWLDGKPEAVRLLQDLMAKPELLQAVATQLGPAPSNDDAQVATR